MYEKTYGSKYAATKDLSRVAVAKLVRADIKALMKSGELPKGKYSVTCKSYAGGGSINATLSNLEVPASFNAARLVWDHEHPHAGHWDCPEEVRALYSPEVEAALKTIESILASYNYDGSDSMTDYFDVRFYSHAKFGCSEAERAAELATVLEAKNALGRTVATSVPTGVLVVEELHGASANDASNNSAHEAHTAYLAFLGAE